MGDEIAPGSLLNEDGKSELVVTLGALKHGDTRWANIGRTWMRNEVGAHTARTSAQYIIALMIKIHTKSLANLHDIQRVIQRILRRCHFLTFPLF